MGLRWNKNECYGGGGGFIPLYRFAVNKQTNKQTNSGAHSRGNTEQTKNTTTTTKCKQATTLRACCTYDFLRLSVRKTRPYKWDNVSWKYPLSDYTKDAG